MGKENPFKEATFDVIALASQLKLEEKARLWDIGIFAVGIIEGSFLASNINTEPGVLRVVIALGPPTVAAIGLITAGIRTERIANIKGQMEGIERQVLRTDSLKEHIS